MGVVYKLKREIVDFIVLRKKAEPSLSCRKLVGLIQKDLGAEVSKSSVNAVLKEFSLSSPVGRRAAAKAPKNFLIPSGKKEQLFQNVAPFLSGTEISPETQRAVSHSQEEKVGWLEQEKERAFVLAAQEPVASETAMEKISEPEQKGDRSDGSVIEEDVQDSTETEIPPFVRLMQDPLAGSVFSDERRVEIELSKGDGTVSVDEERVWGNDKGFLYENAGIFLAAALLWDAQRRPLLGEILSSVSRKAVSEAEWPGLELLFLYQVLIQEDPSSAWEDGARILFDKFFLEKNAASDWVAGFAGLKQETQTSLALSSLVETMDTLIAGVCLTTQQSGAFYFDPLFSMCTRDFFSLPGTTAPLLSVTERVGDMFISNVNPVVLARLSQGIHDKETRDVLDLLDGGAEIKEIALLDSQGKKRAVFDSVPKMSRKYITGIDISSSDLARIDADTIGNSQRFFDPFSERQGSFFDGKFLEEILGREKRVLVVREEGTEEKFALLTNIKEAGNEVLWQYSLFGNNIFLEKRPTLYDKTSYLQGTRTTEEAKIWNFEPQSNKDDLFFEWVNKRVDNLFYGQSGSCGSGCVQDMLRLPGYYKKSSRGHFIRLISPAEETAGAFLKKSVFLLNRQAVFFYDGKRVHFSLETA